MSEQQKQQPQPEPDHYGGITDPDIRKWMDALPQPKKGKQ
jgi:hypothetical protein